ncbi:MAG TPA: hypothetical protein VEM15_17410 [Thermodesulfobacteriota bacterium]|nr:hypothetical protein [Thermodesulfobacteriota bacterium]
MKTRIKLVLVNLIAVGWSALASAQGQQATISVLGVGQILVTAHTRTLKPTPTPFLTFETGERKLLKRVDFALESIDPYPSLLKFKVIYPSKKPSPVVVAVASLPGGSALNFETAILAFVDGQIIEAIPKHIESHSLNALCFGTFGKDQNVGFIYFDFLWEDGEIHYDPHRYEATLLGWTGARFTKMDSKRTKNKYRTWEGAAAELGYQCQCDLLESLNSYGCN